MWRDRLESLELVDGLIGTVGTALQSYGLLSSTVIIFTSDNGYYNGEHRLHKKTFPYEDGLRVPLVVRYPALPANASDVEEFVVNTDLAPTILELAGIDPGTYFDQADIDGRSLVPFLQGQAPSTWRERFLVEHWVGPNTGQIPEFFGIRTAPTHSEPRRNILYTEYAALPAEDVGAQFEYYDLDDDEFQETNVYNAECGGTDCQDLETLLDALKVCGGGPGATGSCQALEEE